MNKRIVIGGIAAAALVAIVALAVTQGSRLKTAASVAKSATMNEEQVTEKSDENAQITQEMQDEFQIPEIQLTPEMQEAIANGEMTLEEAATALLSGGDTAPEPEAASEPSEASEADSAATPEPSEAESVAEAPETVAEAPQPSADAQEAVTEAPQASAPEPPQETASLSGETDGGQAQSDAEAKRAEEERKAAEAKKAEEERKAAEAKQAEEDRKAAEAKKAEDAKNAKVQNLFAQLYVLRDSFNARLDGVINECIAEFLAMDPSKQTKANKIRVVYARMDTIEAMEAECDAQVEAIAAQLDELDPSLGEKARQYYKNEKELKKASLISQYGGG